MLDNIPVGCHAAGCSGTTFRMAPCYIDQIELRLSSGFAGSIRGDRHVPGDPCLYQVVGIGH